MESVLFIFTIIFILIIAQLIKSEYNRKWKIFTVFSLLYYAVIAFVGLSGLLPSAGFTTVEKTRLYLIFLLIYIILSMLIMILLLLFSNDLDKKEGNPTIDKHKSKNAYKNSSFFHRKKYNDSLDA